MGDTRFEEALFVRHKEGAGQQKQQLARLAAAKAASGGETVALVVQYPSSRIVFPVYRAHASFMSVAWFFVMACF
jgi:hypothetical protein